MPTCFFVSDLHGQPQRYLRLFDRIAAERPAGVFLGGDLLPNALADEDADVPADRFVADFVLHHLGRLRDHLGGAYPRVFIIPGNDDPRATFDPQVQAGDEAGLWQYLQARKAGFGDFTVYGYGCVPPTPFQLKDWEVYDVSRYVDPGSVSPEEGMRSVDVPRHKIRHRTIVDDLAKLLGDDPLDRAILLFHSPPYQSKLDRAALDGVRIDHVPLDVHVGSIAIQRLIADRQPLITLHGHIHESARLTGAWRERTGRTHSYSAAHEGPKLALVTFDPEAPDRATRTLL